MEEPFWKITKRKPNSYVWTRLLKKIDKKIISADDELNRAHAETKKVQQTYSDNTSVNYFEVDDRIETSAELQQQRGLVSRLTENESILKKSAFDFEGLKEVALLWSD